MCTRHGNNFLLFTRFFRPLLSLLLSPFTSVRRKVAGSWYIIINVSLVIWFVVRTMHLVRLRSAFAGMAMAAIERKELSKSGSRMKMEILIVHGMPCGRRALNAFPRNSHATTPYQCVVNRRIIYTFFSCCVANAFKELPFFRRYASVSRIVEQSVVFHSEIQKRR